MAKNSLKIISLGGFGEVTKNMFVYETPRDILIVDCGVGFPEEEMIGIDLIVPDISYLKERLGKIRAIVLSHGHDDHIGGLPYILPQIPKNLPIFGPRWAVALSALKLQEFGIQANFNEINEKSRIQVGDFSLEFIQVTHSIPDTYHIVIKTPVGIIYHAADFKLDLIPVMGKPTAQEKIRAVGKRKVLCLLSDCLRAENPGFTPPEAKLEEMFEEEMKSCRGKFLVTTMSSNISRLKQAVEVSRRLGRKVVLLGRSIKENMKLAEKLGYLRFPSGTFVDKKEIKNHPANRLTLLVAGSQGQIGSALDRIAAQEFDLVKIQPGDKVVFSTDYIPGNETAIYRLIDNIYRLGGEVVYQDIHSNVHVSGHGSQEDLGKLMKMVSPRFMIPIGGNFRHMVAYQKLAVEKGFKAHQVLLPDDGEVVEFFPEEKVKISQKIEIHDVLIDALEGKDIESVILRDRKVLAGEGMVVAVIVLDKQTHLLQGEPEIITRGFIYAKEDSGFFRQTKNKIRQLIRKIRVKEVNKQIIRRRLQNDLERFFFKTTSRRPMVLPIIIEV
jgi:ribonuclease J